MAVVGVDTVSCPPSDPEIPMACVPTNSDVDRPSCCVRYREVLATGVLKVIGVAKVSCWVSGLGVSEVALTTVGVDKVSPCAGSCGLPTLMVLTVVNVDTFPCCTGD